MKVIPISAQDQQTVKTLQAAFQQAQAAHVQAYRNLLAQLQSIANVQTEAGRKTRLALDDSGQNIIIG